GTIGHAAVYLHSAHARPLACGKDLDFFLFLYRAGDQRPGNDGAETLHSEYTVNRQAEERFRIARGNFGRETDDLAFQLIEAGPFERAHGNDGGAGCVKKRATHKIFNLHAHDAEGVFVDQIGLGDDGDAARDGEQAADFKVFTGLRLDGFVG